MSLPREKASRSIVYPGKDSIVVCFASDENYEPHLWVAISSLIEHAISSRDYYIYILDGGIKNKNNFTTIVNGDKRFHIDFINMENEFINSYESRHLTRAAYFRLAIFSLFEKFPRVIYIDADSYILGDVAELFDLPLGNKVIAGAPDSITYEIPWREKYIRHNNFYGKAIDYYKEYLGLSEEKLKYYFSSGVLLFNLKEMNLTEKKAQMKILLKNSYFSHDQDILNLLFDSKQTFKLPREWNFFNSAPILKHSDFMVKEERDNYLKGKISPKLVSYVLKPWERENKNAPYANLYWEKLKKSPYYQKVKYISSQNAKLNRFLKLSFKEKIKFLTSREAIRKYGSILKSLLK